MSTPSKYPLEQMIPIKKNRLDQAIAILEEKKVLLAKAEQKLKEAQDERDIALRHKTDKLEQLRSALDEGAPSAKIQQMKIYLKLVQEKLLEKEKIVQNQQKQVDLAKNQVELATQEVFQRKKDLEKLEIHKTEWQKEVHYSEVRKEALEEDEQGSSTFTTRKAEERRRKED